MPEHDETTTALWLDECIQALLEGEDWRKVTGPEPGPEVVPLVAVGQWLLQLARNVPPASSNSRTRIWKRVTEAIDAGRMAVQMLALSGSDPGSPGEANAYR